MTLTRAMVFALIAFALASSSGCFRYRTHVPGVIDMRTDASEVPVSRARVKNLRETELLLLVGGRGVASHGQELVVEDRHFWVAGFIPLFNTDARDELAVLVNATGAARDLQIGEGQTEIDVLAALVLPNFVPLVGYLLPSYTFYAHATPIRLERGDTGLGVPARDGREERAPAVPGPSTSERPGREARDVESASPDARVGVDDARETDAHAVPENDGADSAPLRPPPDEGAPPPLLDEIVDPSDEGGAE